MIHLPTLSRLFAQPGLYLSTGLLIVVLSLIVSQRVRASSLSSTPVKVAVYQGVVTVAPTTNTILELGNAGTDIAANTSLLFKPGPGHALQIGQQGTTLEGGEVVLNSSHSSYPVWRIDQYGDNLRFYVVPPGQPGQEKVVINRNGDTHIIGKLCFGFATTDFNGTSGACINNWSDLGGSGTPSGNIEQVLTRGNASNNALAIGVPPGLGSGSVYQGATALVDVNNTVGLASTLSGIEGRVREPMGGASGIYAENPNGYAGYFSGQVAFRTPAYTNAWVTHSATLYVKGPVLNANGYPLEVYNANAQGLAAKLTGAVHISNTITSGGSTALTVTNTRAAGGTTVRAASPSQSGSAVYALGAASSIDQTGLIAYPGSGAGASYAGFFRGHVGTEGYFRAGIQLNNSPRTKLFSELRVCATANDTCLGRYVYTSSGTPPLQTSATDFCYEDINNYTTTCVDAYTGGPGSQQYELR